MVWYLAVFRSKTEVFKFLEEMKRRGGYTKLTATPKEAKIGCGLSVKFAPMHLSIAKTILTTRKFYGFHGIYKVEQKGKTSSISKII